MTKRKIASTKAENRKEAERRKKGVHKLDKRSVKPKVADSIRVRQEKAAIAGSYWNSTAVGH